MRNTAIEYISADTFSESLKRIKDQKGVSWTDLAMECGRTRGAITSYAYGTRQSVMKSTADDILRRLAGEKLPPTRLQVKEYTVAARKTQTEQRSETLQSKKLDQRKASVAELRRSLRTVRLDPS